MHGDVLAKNVVAPNPQPRRLPRVLEVLRSLANNTAGKELIVSANHGQPSHIHLGTNRAIRTDLHTFINHRVRSYLDGGVEFRLGMDNGGRMDHTL